VIIPDANVFLYAYDAGSAQHLTARKWVEEVLSGEEPVRLPWQVRGPLMTDAQLAALTLEYGGTLYTTDRDFSRFPGLKWKNPLARKSIPET
jgi:predicted nucleic acid-binding protein